MKSKKQVAVDLMDQDSEEDSIVDNKSDDGNGSSLKKLRNKMNIKTQDEELKKTLKKKNKPSTDNEKTPTSVESGGSSNP